MTRSTLLAIALTAVLLGTGAEERAPLRGRSTSEKDIRRGQLLVNVFCGRCHGRDGGGAKGPDLTSGRLPHGNDDDAIRANIKNGIPGTGMPAFPFDEDTLWQLISFLRSREQERKDLPREDAGDPERGKVLFVQHKCDTCHWTGRSGGRLGPDLSRWRGSAEFFRRALTHPDEEIDPRYQRVTLSFADGRTMTGLRLYEDTYYLLMIDEQQHLHTIPRGRIDQLVLPDQSLMASYAKVLSESAIRDMAAYVSTLREKPAP